MRGLVPLILAFFILASPGSPLATSCPAPEVRVEQEMVFAGSLLTVVGEHWMTCEGASGCSGQVDNHGLKDLEVSIGRVGNRGTPLRVVEDAGEDFAFETVIRVPPLPAGEYSVRVTASNGLAARAPFQILSE